MAEIALEEVHHSSNVKALGYDAGTKTLAVRYHSGHVYHYDQVSAEHYAALRAAKSKGGYIAQHIKGAHRAKKVSP